MRFRLIITEPEGARDAGVVHFEAANDTKAITFAEPLRVGRAAELWRVYKVVKRWPRTGSRDALERHAAPKISSGMDKKILANMRSRVVMCRSLAKSTTNTRMAKTLRQIADEGEADIRRLEGVYRQDDRSGS